MSAQPKPIERMTLEEKIAELDRMDAPGDEQPIPLIAAEPEPEDEDTDVVQAMQELLLKHEDTQVNRVEDPDLMRVLNELRGIAHSNIADVFEMSTVLDYIGLDDDEKEVYQNTSRLVVKDITQLPRDISACIQTIKVTSTAKGDVVEVKMYDKLVSLDKLMRFHGAYIKDNEQLGSQDTGIMDLLFTSIGSQGLPKIGNNDA